MGEINQFSYETAKLLNEKKLFIVEEFFDKNIIGRSIEESDTANIQNIYQNIISYYCLGKSKELATAYMELTALYIELEIPYITLLNELNQLQHVIMEYLINYEKKDDIITIYKVGKASENIIAKEYLYIYTQKLISMCNNRLSSLGDMVEQFVVEHYADHLHWLIDLTQALQKNEIDQFPQTDKTLCKFGKWLISDAKGIVQNNSKLKELDRVHSQLHYISSQVKHILLNNEKDYDVLLTYLEKAELLSLSIGTELALIDNTIINKKATKDSLTGALGRQVLAQLFQNQYELSLATNTRFAIALCDLDHFKNINDTYGHVVGDKMLFNFVRIVKENIRSSDIIIRYGGEEFILILPAIDLQKAYIVLDKIRTSFEKFELLDEERTIKTTVSMGLISLQPKETYNNIFLNHYINKADMNLYKAKENGRNQIVKEDQI